MSSSDKFPVNGPFQLDFDKAKAEATRLSGARGNSHSALPRDKAEAILSVVNSVPLQYPSEDGSTETLIVKFEEANKNKDRDGNDIDVPLFEYEDIKWVSTEAIAVAAHYDKWYGDIDNE